MKALAVILFSLSAFRLPLCAQVCACTASWYDAPAGPGGTHLTCASWFYPLGTRLIVHEVHNGLSVVVVVTDRGPAHRLVRAGRRIDLSRPAFAVLDGLELGLADVVVEPAIPHSAIPIPHLEK